MGETLAKLLTIPPGLPPDWEVLKLAFTELSQGGIEQVVVARLAGYVTEVLFSHHDIRPPSKWELASIFHSRLPGVSQILFQMGLSLLFVGVF